MISRLPTDPTPPAKEKPMNMLEAWKALTEAFPDEYIVVQAEVMTFDPLLEPGTPMGRFGVYRSRGSPSWAYGTDLGILVRQVIAGTEPSREAVAACTEAAECVGEVGRA